VDHDQQQHHHYGPRRASRPPRPARPGNLAARSGAPGQAVRPDQPARATGPPRLDPGPAPCALAASPLCSGLTSPGPRPHPLCAYARAAPPCACDCDCGRLPRRVCVCGSLPRPAGGGRRRGVLRARPDPDLAVGAADLEQTSPGQLLQAVVDGAAGHAPALGQLGHRGQQRIAARLQPAQDLVRGAVQLAVEVISPVGERPGRDEPLRIDQHAYPRGAGRLPSLPGEGWALWPSCQSRRM
jgi:hypothetical protein